MVVMYIAIIYIPLPKLIKLVFHSIEFYTPNHLE